MPSTYYLLKELDVQQGNDVEALQIRSIARLETGHGDIIVLNVIMRDTVVRATSSFTAQYAGQDQAFMLDKLETRAELARIAREDVRTIDDLWLEPGWSRGAVRIPLALFPGILRNSQTTMRIAVPYVVEDRERNDGVGRGRQSASVLIHPFAEPTGPELAWGFYDARKWTVSDAIPYFDKISQALRARDLVNGVVQAAASRWAEFAGKRQAEEVEYMMPFLDNFEDHELKLEPTISLFVKSNGASLAEDAARDALSWAGTLIASCQTRNALRQAYSDLGRALLYYSSELSDEACISALLPTLDVSTLLSAEKAVLKQSLIPWLAALAGKDARFACDPHPRSRHGRAPHNLAINYTFLSVLKPLHARNLLAYMAEWMVRGFYDHVVECLNSSRPIVDLNGKIVRGVVFPSPLDAQAGENGLYMHRKSMPDYERDENDHPLSEGLASDRVHIVWYEGESLRTKERVKEELRDIEKVQQLWQRRMAGEDVEIKSSQYAWEIFGQCDEEESDYTVILLASYGTADLTLAEATALRLAETLGISRFGLWGHPQSLELATAFAGERSVSKVEVSGLSYKSITGEDIHHSTQRDSGLGGVWRVNADRRATYAAVCQKLCLNVEALTTVDGMRRDFALTGELPMTAKEDATSTFPHWATVDLWSDDTKGMAGMQVRLPIHHPSLGKAVTGDRLRFYRTSGSTFFTEADVHALCEIAGTLTQVHRPTGPTGLLRIVMEDTVTPGERLRMAVEGNLPADRVGLNLERPLDAKKSGTSHVAVSVTHCFLKDANATRFAADLDDQRLKTFLQERREHVTRPMNIAPETIRNLAWQVRPEQKRESRYVGGGDKEHLVVAAGHQTNAEEALIKLTTPTEDAVNEILSAAFGKIEPTPLAKLQSADPALFARLCQFGVEFIRVGDDENEALRLDLTWANFVGIGRKMEHNYDRMEWFLTWGAYVDRVLPELE